MISCCANPACGKPLHYLREGRIYIFECVVGTDGRGKAGQRHLEHYWLCGACIPTLALVQDAQGRVHLLPRRDVLHDHGESVAPAPQARMAS